MIIMIFMAVTSSGASEMLAVSSLFTFDVYRRYLKPKARPRICMCMCPAVHAPAAQKDIQSDLHLTSLDVHQSGLLSDGKTQAQSQGSS